MFWAHIYCVCIHVCVCVCVCVNRNILLTLHEVGREDACTANNLNRMPAINLPLVQTAQYYSFDKCLN